MNLKKLLIMLELLILLLEQPGIKKEITITIKVKL